MSKQSDKVKRWRKRCKERIIVAMGGGCCVCGYNRCQSGLALHHLDPKEKDFSLGAIRANPKNWLDLVKELRKCILVCHLCHCEIHEGLIQVPTNVPRFNEDFVDYKTLESEPEELSPCPVCGKDKPKHLINCSLECAGRARRKVKWDDIDLVEELKTKTAILISEELGCSDAAVHKRMKKLRLK